jgi:hypothetical protein
LPRGTGNASLCRGGSSLSSDPFWPKTLPHKSSQGSLSERGLFILDI